jgi:hypothetical protein
MHNHHHDPVDGNLTNDAPWSDSRALCDRASQTPQSHGRNIIVPTQVPLELYAVPALQAPHMYPVRLLAQALFQAQYVDTSPAASVSAEDETQVYVAESELNGFVTLPAHAPALHRSAETLPLYQTAK